ncbi:superoxide dismutase [Fe], chloroplastic-like isoform X1 [Amaranthus tricolor]|uniref:superoxide dismutase [Fe], chloroplastic-like isoform X1 n=1 Tax=Amaranthus tricolor TaxID=29722 RepID=UPI00258708A7|nr:superoxide dismutase [Fe], chloroplastic-like isoform X1 [Amaranthus tricolor]
MSAVSATSGISLSSTIIPHEGFKGGLKSIPVSPWKSHETRVRRGGATVVTAKFDLKPPPYPFDALEPIMSKQTFDFHWGKHHRAYVDNLNKQIVGTELDELPLEEVIRITYNKGDFLPSFNNAAQAWNHEFFWESMKPGGGGKPSGELLAQIEKDFGSFETFTSEFKTAAATQFGSGWAWLVYKSNTLDVGNAVNPKPSEDDKKLLIVKTPNAVTPLVWDYYPLLTIDVWEHAYYLDYQNRRPDYISIFMEKLVSWDAVNARYEAAKACAAE